MTKRVKVGTYVEYHGAKTGLNGEKGFVKSIQDFEGTKYETVMVQFDNGVLTPCATTNLIPLEDPRKTGLKNGLRQLTIEQLESVINYDKEMVLDTYNYEDGKFCPLAVGVGLDKWMEKPTHDKVFGYLTLLGYKVYNTRGILGEFYTTNRKEDLLEAAKEVLEEKKHANQ